MIAIIDYGMGNLRSVQKAFEKVGAQAVVTQDKNAIQSAEKIVLPGVGAFAPAMEKLNTMELIPEIKESIQKGKPFLGICLGLQLLFDRSSEGGNITGLGIIPGSVERFTSLKVPHMGWNQLTIRQENSPIMKGIENLSNVYFCHSYYVKPKDARYTATTTDYGVDFTSSISNGKLFGVQFHPEKSQAVGLTILKNFTEVAS